MNARSTSICRDDLVIGAGSNAGALLVDGLGDGLLLEAPGQDFDFLRNTSFNLLQGCRMRNTKTVSASLFSPQEKDSSLPVRCRPKYLTSDLGKEDLFHLLM